MAEDKDKTASAAAAPAAAQPAQPKAPAKPDEDAFKESLTKAEKEHADVMAKYNAIKSQIDIALPNKNKDKDKDAAQTPTQKRRQELIAQANEIRQKQGTGKKDRTSKLDQVKRLDEQVRSRIAEQKTARGKVAYKSADDVDREIARLEGQVNGGMMKLVDEKKALAEISALRKQRKQFSGFDDSQKQIDDLRAKIKGLKDGMEDPEQKALSEQYNKIQAELDTIKAEQDEAYKNLSGLRDERSRLQAEQQEKFQAIRKLKDDFYAQRNAYREHLREARDRARERQQAERDRYVKEKKMDRAQKMLDEASDPAYLEEIRRANSLLHFFDPSHAAAEKAPLVADSGLGAQAQRKVDDAGIKGTKLVRKQDREDDYLPAAKKGGKKGKKGAAAEAGAKTFNCPPSVMEDCAFMGINPPMSSAEVPDVIEKIKEKLEHWKADQTSQTQKNIEKAKKEIEKLEAEEAAEADGANGDAKDKGVTGVTADLKDASLDDKKKEAKA